MSGEAVEVRRSPRRRRTVSAYRDGARTVVLIPSRFSRAEERRWVDSMLARLAAGEHRRRPGDDQLTGRAQDLSRRYLAGRARLASVTWSDQQRARWGSCTPASGTIRISTRVRGMPSWVLDYVLLHELAHLLVPSHDETFWALLGCYPRTERARGFLEGVCATAGLRLGAEDLAAEEPSGNDEPGAEVLDVDEPGAEVLDVASSRSAAPRDMGRRADAHW